MENKSIKYEFNPYTFARISAMRGLFLKKSDYDKVMKMDPNEIIKFLQEGVYNQEINSLAMKYSGIKLVEAALNKNLSKSFIKLRQIADPDIQLLMDLYLKRYDYWNLKTLLRAKLTKAEEEEIEDILLPVGSLKFEKLKYLYNKETIREILHESNIIPINEIRTELDRFEESKDLSEIENILDYTYYIDSIKTAERIPKQGILFSDFFGYEIAIYNLRLILKKIFFKLDKQKVQKYLIFNAKNLSRANMLNLLNEETVAAFLREIKRTSYGRLFESEKEDTKDPLLKYDILFEEFLLGKRILLLHQHPLTVDVILGFMFEKEIEVKNLKIIVKSKKLELDEDYIKRLIVIEK